MFSINRRPFKTPARDLDLLLHHYGKNLQPVLLFHLILTGWFLYFTHWLSKLETWLKMNWLKFNPDKMNAQGWKTIEIGRHSSGRSLYRIFHQGMLEFRRTACDDHLARVRLSKGFGSNNQSLKPGCIN